MKKRVGVVLLSIVVICAMGSLAGCSKSDDGAKETKEKKTVTAELQEVPVADLKPLMDAGIVTGIQEMTFEAGTEGNLKDLTFVDSKLVKAIEIDDSTVDYTKTGDYTATYTISFDGAALRKYVKEKGMSLPFATKGDVIPVKTSVAIHVVTKEEAEKDAESGETVVTKDTVQAVTKANQSKASKDATAAATKPSKPASSSSSSGSSKPSSSSSSSSKPSGSSSGSTSNESNKPAHTHVWKPVYKTVHHDAVYNTVTKEVPIYETKTVNGWCKECGKFVNIRTHQLPTEVGGEGYTSHNLTYHKVTTQVGTKTETEQVLVKGAYDEQVIDHYECSCGARK